MLRLSCARTNFAEEIEFCKCIGDALGHLMQFVNKTWTQGQFSQKHSKSINIAEDMVHWLGGSCIASVPPG